METLTTHGIRISVSPVYIPEESAPIRQQYVHAYRIVIENQSNLTVQLLRRHWFIAESNGTIKEVEGEGVVGEQPILKPGEVYEYASWCPLVTDIGKMWGYYTMLRVDDGSTFQVPVPAFILHPPFKMN
ncbi:MAG: protein ApaG [Saprospiraceae bacterium]|jgi:ApaG protein|nr:MAG: protein ApaG [Saprospiraceae bacterium]